LAYEGVRVRREEVAEDVASLLPERMHDGHDALGIAFVAIALKTERAFSP